MAAINWQDVITTLAGNAVLLAAAAWLIKTLVSNRLALEAEKFKIEVKASADTEIERVKAFLTRAARVHERQVDTRSFIAISLRRRHIFNAWRRLAGSKAKCPLMNIAAYARMPSRRHATHSRMVAC